MPLVKLIDNKDSSLGSVDSKPTGPNDYSEPYKKYLSANNGLPKLKALILFHLSDRVAPVEVDQLQPMREMCVAAELLSDRRELGDKGPAVLAAHEVYGMAVSDALRQICISYTNRLKEIVHEIDRNRHYHFSYEEIGLRAKQFINFCELAGLLIVERDPRAFEAHCKSGHDSVCYALNDGVHQIFSQISGQLAHKEKNMNQTIIQQGDGSSVGVVDQSGGSANRNTAVQAEGDITNTKSIESINTQANNRTKGLFVGGIVLIAIIFFVYYLITNDSKPLATLLDAIM